METSDNCWLVEVVAGIVDPGESPAEVCHREAQEEAGITLENLTPIRSFLVSPGACTERIHMFIGQVDSSTAQGIHGLDYEAEDIKVFTLKLETAHQWIEEGKIDNSIAIIAIQWLLLNKSKIRQQWGFEA